MMTKEDLRIILNDVLLASGFSKRGRAWAKRTDELVWLLELDPSPYGEQYSVDMGLWFLRLETEVLPASANNCHFLMHLENVPLEWADVEGKVSRDVRSAAIAAFDLTSGMEPVERERLLRSTLKALVVYLEDITSESDVRSHYDAGDFKSAFIRKDAKEMLRSSD